MHVQIWIADHSNYSLGTVQLKHVCGTYNRSAAVSYLVGQEDFLVCGWSVGWLRALVQREAIFLSHNRRQGNRFAFHVITVYYVKVIGY